MPSTVYKGDLAEVTFGHETGFQLQEGFQGITAISHVVSGDTSVITIAATGAAGYLMTASSNSLAYPMNMLVGCRMRIIGGTNWADDDYGSTGRLFTIVANATNTITVTPALKDADANAGPNDIIIIDSFATPTIDVTNTDSRALNSAHVSKESVLTDQFVGIAATIALPETKVDIKRYHVVGVGRDVAVQAPGKFTNEGGSMELMLNSPRWLYYCLGGEMVNAASKGVAYQASGAGAWGGTLGLTTNIAMGDTHVHLTHAADAIFLDAGGTADAIAVGDYIIIEEVIAGGADYLLPVVQHKEVDLSATPSNYFGKSGGDDHDDFYESGLRSEIRRITAIDIGNRRLHVDDPWSFPHDGNASGQLIRFVRFQGAGVTTYGGPDMAVTASGYGVLTNPTTRLLFPRWHLPSFALETSIRSRDTGSYSTRADAEQTENVPGGASDSKQLTRIFKGCKVSDWSMSADTDGALKLNVNFNAAMCYTDTGRLETTAADRFTAHRMFENTASTATARKEAGIAERTQKPYFFYNGSITVGAQTLAQVTNFTLSGSTGMTYHHTIRTSTVTETVSANGQSAMQVPFGGSRNASLAVEGKETFDLSMEVIVDDPIFWHQMRGAQEFKGAGNEIRMDFQKQGAAGTKERMTLIIDDYYITEAPLPIPEDKGVIRSALTIVPKSVRIVSTDALLHC
jgi:hypothetical protein